MPIRLRLALLYTSILVAALLCFVGWFVEATATHLMAEVDSTLASWANVTAGRVDASSLGHSNWNSIPKANVFRLPGLHVQILNTSGQVVYCSESLGAQKLPPNTRALSMAKSGRAVYYTARQSGGSIRVYELPVRDDKGDVRLIVQAGKSLSHVTVTQDVMRRLALAGTVVAVLVMGLLSFVSTSRALRPVATLTATARTIAASGEFGMRVESGSTKDELGKLAVAFNEMLASLDRVNSSHRRFLADASHELRSPLTSLRNNVGFLMRAKDIPDGARQETLADMESEVARMGKLVSQLLYLARTDQGNKLAFEELDLTELITDEFTSFKTLAGERHFSLEASPSLVVYGDGNSIRQALRALIENAIHYTQPYGNIVVTALRRNQVISVTVADDGMGIATEDQPRIFEQFYRARTARKADPEGVGLGLSIVRRVVELHHAELALESAEGVGSRFSVSFPEAGTLRKEADL